MSDFPPMKLATFNIGDRVRIINEQSSWCGQCGTVRRLLDPMFTYSVLVLRDVERHNELDRFGPEELEPEHLHLY